MIEAVVFNLADAFAAEELDAAALASRLQRLSDVGVHVVLTGMDRMPTANASRGTRRGGPGRLFVWSNDPSEILEVDPAEVAGRLSLGEGVSGYLDDDPWSDGRASVRGAVAWARRHLTPGGGPEAVAVLDPAGGASLLSCLDTVVADHSQRPMPVEDPSWRVDVEGFDVLREREVESWFTTGNGRCGTRGSLEEGGPESSPALYVAAIFGTTSVEPAGPVLVRGPEWTHLHPRVEGQTVALHRGETLEHRRVLDMRQGILFRQWRQRLPSGQEWSFRSTRFASLAERRTLAMEAEATADGREVTLAGDVPVEPDQDGVESVETGTSEGSLSVTMHAKDGAAVRFRILTEESGGRLARTVDVGRSLDGSPDDASQQDLPRAEPAGIVQLRASHRLAWQDRWRTADVAIHGDPTFQRAVRFALYHLISAGDADSDQASIGARGLTGPGYRGHVFWDTDVFVLPFFVWTHPPTARALLAYRYRTLPAARAKAQQFGYAGALYAWESAHTGEETTPPVAWRSDGTPVEILTGVKEHHISADVAWAVWQYWQVTGDDRFLVEMGAEILLETARFWASRASVGVDGRYHINDVIGPDEYHEGVDDNAFTNVLARWNLERALEVCDLVPTIDPSGWEALRHRVGLQPSERPRWETVARGLVDGFDETSLIYEQFAGFFGLEDIRAADLAPRPYAGDTLLGRERTRGAQMVKQADVLMLAHMLPDVVPADAVTANYEYYEPRTSHGSSLSPAVHALVAARIGRLEQAADYCRMAGAIDLDDRMGNAAHGVHMATMGGLWQALVLGLGGVRADGGAIRLDPHVPRSWSGLTFAVQWRGTRVEAEVGHESVRIHLDGPAFVALGTGDPSLLEPGQFRAHRHGERWSEIEPEDLATAPVVVPPEATSTVRDLLSATAWQPSPSPQGACDWDSAVRLGGPGHPLVFVPTDSRIAAVPRRLVVVHDGTQGSSPAMDAANEVARGSGADIVVVHVLEPRPPDSHGGLTAPRIVDHGPYDWDEWREEFLRRFCRSSPGVPVTLDLLSGDPVDAILEAASRHHPDLVVGVWQGQWVPDADVILKELVHRSPCPLLVVFTPQDVPGGRQASPGVGAEAPS